MGRASYEQAQKNREKIVESAMRLFLRYGVDNVSVAQIADDAGLTTGAFYKHFESKETLVQEAFELSFKRSASSWQKASERAEQNSISVPTAIVSYYFQKKPPEQTCPMLAFAPHVRSSSSNAATLAEYKKGTENLFTLFIEQQKKTHGNSGIEQKAAVLFAAMIGANFLAQATGGAKWVKSIQDAVLSGIAELQRSPWIK